MIPLPSPFCLCSHNWLEHQGMRNCDHAACGCGLFRPDPRAADEDERDPTWEEALAEFNAGEPVTVIQPHAFAEATLADLDICWCGKGAGHLIHRRSDGDRGVTWWGLAGRGDYPADAARSYNSGLARLSLRMSRAT